jgi:hypothetical protein
MAQTWEKDLINIRVANISDKGMNLDFSVNGRIFHLKNNSVNRVPRAVYQALVDAVQTEYQVAGDIDKGRVVETSESPRVMVQILSDEQAAQVIDTKGKKEKRVVDEILGEDKPKKTFSKSDIEAAV